MLRSNHGFMRDEAKAGSPFKLFFEHLYYHVLLAYSFDPMNWPEYENSLPCPVKVDSARAYIFMKLPIFLQ